MGRTSNSRLKLIFEGTRLYKAFKNSKAKRNKSLQQ